MKYTMLYNSKRYSMHNCYAYVERKHKLEPCLTVGSESTEETGFYSNVQIEPSNEQDHCESKDKQMCVGK